MDEYSCLIRIILLTKMVLFVFIYVKIPFFTICIKFTIFVL